MKQLRTYFFLILTIPFLLGCASIDVKTYIHPNADLLGIRRIALLPFNNLAGIADASRKIHNIFLAELLTTGYFDVVESGEVNNALKELNITDPDSLGSEEVLKLGEYLGVEAVVFGIVEEYRQAVSTGTGSFPEVALSIRMVDVQSNIVVWMSSNSKGGSSGVSFLGIGETHSISELTRTVIEEMFDSLKKELKSGR